MYNTWIDKKKHSIKRVNIFLNHIYERYSGNVKVGLDLSNYAIKADVKGATGVDASDLGAKSD